MQVFKTVREAAIAGSKEAVPLTRQTGYEYGGLIMTVNGGYTYTSPETSHAESHTDFGPIFATYIHGFPLDGVEPSRIPYWTAKIRKAGIVSVYHTHPCNKDTLGEKLAVYFSEADMRGLMRDGFKTAYMAVACSGKVYEATDNLRVLWPEDADGPAALGAVIGQA